MKRFIDDVCSTGYCTKNAKGRALLQYCWLRYNHMLLNSDSDVDVMLADIRRKIEELNKEFPRLKQNMKVTVLPPLSVNTSTLYYVRWEDKNSTTAFVIRALPVVGEMKDGQLTKEDEP